MFKLIRRLIVLSAIGAAVGYFMQQRRREDTWDAEDPEGDWGMAQTDLQHTPPAQT